MDLEFETDVTAHEIQAKVACTFLIRSSFIFLTLSS